MKQFNVTAQIYKTNDPDKQTIFMNEIVQSTNSNIAMVKFYDLVDKEYSVLKIYSVEEIPQVVS